MIASRIACAMSFITFVAFALACGGGNESSRPATKKDASADFKQATELFRDGEEVSIVKDRSPLWIGDQTMLDYTRLTQEKDSKGISRLERDGKLYYLALGTKVKVVEARSLSVVVKVLDGPQQGKQGVVKDISIGSLDRR